MDFSKDLHNPVGRLNLGQQSNWTGPNVKGIKTFAGFREGIREPEFPWENDVSPLFGKPQSSHPHVEAANRKSDGEKTRTGLYLGLDSIDIPQLKLSDRKTNWDEIFPKRMNLLNRDEKVSDKFAAPADFIVAKVMQNSAASTDVGAQNSSESEIEGDGAAPIRCEKITATTGQRYFSENANDEGQSFLRILQARGLHDKKPNLMGMNSVDGSDKQKPLEHNAAPQAMRVGPHKGDVSGAQISYGAPRVVRINGDTVKETSSVPTEYVQAPLQKPDEENPGSESEYVERLIDEDGEAMSNPVHSDTIASKSSTMTQGSEMDQQCGPDAMSDTKFVFPNLTSMVGTNVDGNSMKTQPTWAKWNEGSGELLPKMKLGDVSSHARPCCPRPRAQCFCPLFLERRRDTE